MKISRRELALSSLLPAALPSSAAAREPEDPQAELQRNSEFLAKIRVAMSVEPAFQFKA